MKLGTLVDSKFQVALIRLMSQPTPLRAAFKLKAIGTQVKAEINKYEEARQEVLLRLGSKDEAGNILFNEDGSVQFAPENFSQLAEELNSLCSREVNIGTISVVELGSRVELSAEDVSLLEEIVKE